MICGSSEYDEIINVERAPTVHAIPANTKLGDRRFGKIRLVHCRICGHIFNCSIENNTSISDVDGFLTNAPISESMIARHEQTVDYLSVGNEAPLRVLDVGAGSGSLAAAFAKHRHLVTVVEPSSMIDTKNLSQLSVRVIKDMWPTADLQDAKFDLILCVQVLEHVDSPRDFLADLAEHLSDNGRIYLEVPSGEWVIDHGSPADIHYPHRNYFFELIILRIASETSLTVTRIRSLLNGRDVGYILQHSDTKRIKSAGLMSIKLFEKTLELSINAARFRIANWGATKQYAIYGANAGSQALFGFIPECNPKYIFDDTPTYEGSYAYSPNSRFPIVRPTVQLLSGLDVVIIAAYIHDASIYKKIRGQGFDGEIYSLRPPSDARGTVKSLFE